jgi:hypothetical protein
MQRQSSLVERWSGGAVERWSGGAVERWSGGAVERFQGIRSRLAGAGPGAHVAVLLDLVPGGFAKEISAAQAAGFPEGAIPKGQRQPPAPSSPKSSSKTCAASMPRGATPSGDWRRS